MSIFFGWVCKQGLQPSHGQKVSDSLKRKKLCIQDSLNHTLDLEVDDGSGDNISTYYSKVSIKKLCSDRKHPTSGFLSILALIVVVLANISIDQDNQQNN